MVIHESYMARLLREVTIPRRQDTLTPWSDGDLFRYTADETLPRRKRKVKEDLAPSGQHNLMRYTGNDLPVAPGLSHERKRVSRARRYSRPMGDTESMDEGFFDPNSTENEGRHRLREPGTVTDYFRRKGSTPGVSYVMGKDKRTGKSIVQSVRFDKSKFDEKKASAWWREKGRRST